MVYIVCHRQLYRGLWVTTDKREYRLRQKTIMKFDKVYSTQTLQTIEICSQSSSRVRTMAFFPRLVLNYLHNCSLIVSMTVPMIVPMTVPLIVSMIVPVKSLTSSRSRRPPNVFVEMHYLKLASYPQSTQTLLQYQIVVLCRRTGSSKAVQLPGSRGDTGIARRC